MPLSAGGTRMQRDYGCHSRERKQQKGGKRIQERTMKQNETPNPAQSYFFDRLQSVVSKHRHAAKNHVLLRCQT